MGQPEPFALRGRLPIFWSTRNGNPINGYGSVAASLLRRSTFAVVGHESPMRWGGYLRGPLRSASSMASPIERNGPNAGAIRGSAPVRGLGSRPVLRDGVRSNSPFPDIPRLLITVSSFGWRWQRGSHAANDDPQTNDRRHTCDGHQQEIAPAADELPNRKASALLSVGDSDTDLNLLTRHRRASRANDLQVRRRTTGCLPFEPG